jgi:hypothetical protein
MSLKHPDSIGHRHAHQEVSVANVMHFVTNNLYFYLHAHPDMCSLCYLIISPVARFLLLGQGPLRG